MIALLMVSSISAQIPHQSETLKKDSNTYFAMKKASAVLAIISGDVDSVKVQSDGKYRIFKDGFSFIAEEKELIFIAIQIVNLRNYEFQPSQGNYGPSRGGYDPQGGYGSPQGDYGTNFGNF